MSRNACASFRIAAGLLLVFPAFSQQFAAVYPHSIVPGGVRSPVQYAEQQGDADIGFLRPEYLQHDISAYVDYKEGSSVLWTSARVTLKKGELVYSDKYGHIVRGRCGNDVSVERPVKAFVPPGKVDLDTPEIGWMPTPVLPVEIAQQLPFEFPERWPEKPAYPEEAVRPLLQPLSITPLPIIPTFVANFLPVRARNVGIPALSPTPVAIPTAIPEPATLWLLLAAAGVLSARKLLTRQPTQTESDPTSDPVVDL